MLACKAGAQAQAQKPTQLSQQHGNYTHTFTHMHTKTKHLMTRQGSMEGKEACPGQICSCVSGAVAAHQGERVARAQRRGRRLPQQLHAEMPHPLRPAHTQPPSHTLGPRYRMGPRKQPCIHVTLHPHSAGLAQNACIMQRTLRNTSHVNSHGAMLHLVHPPLKGIYSSMAKADFSLHKPGTSAHASTHA